MTEDPARTVRILVDDRAGGTTNASLGFTQVTSSSGGRNTMAWYSFPADPTSAFLPLDAAAGITNMRFTVDGRLEDQSGIGFALQDDVVFAASSCFVPDPDHVGNVIGGRFDIAVGSGFNYESVERWLTIAYVGSQRRRSDACLPRVLAARHDQRREGRGN